MSEIPVFELEREFNAPRDLVWKTWTDPKHLARWYGPGAETIIHEFAAKPGGLWLNEMKFGENSGYERMEFLEVVAPERLVWLHSSANAEWEIAPSMMMENWPKTLLATVTFEEAGDKTKLRLTWAPHNANEAEHAAFAMAMAGFGKGWGSGMDIIAEILSELQS